jgi:hypothetical protein
MTELRVVRQLGVFGLERHGDCRMIVECERDEGRGCLSGFRREGGSRRWAGDSAKCCPVVDICQEGSESDTKGGSGGSSGVPSGGS